MSKNFDVYSPEIYVRLIFTNLYAEVLETFCDSPVSYVTILNTTILLKTLNLRIFGEGK